MGPLPSLRPRRSLAFPFVLVLYPLLWFVMREAELDAVGRPVTDVLPGVLGLTAAALAVSYALAAVVDAAVVPDAESVPSGVRPLVGPSNWTLATFAAVSLALGAYVVASSAVRFPGWVDPLAGAVGVVIGWPLLLVVLATIVVGDAVVALPVPVEVALVAVGVALSAAWLFVLSGWLARLVGSRVAAGTGP